MKDISNYFHYCSHFLDKLFEISTMNQYQQPSISDDTALIRTAFQTRVIGPTRRIRKPKTRTVPTETDETCSICLHTLQNVCVCVPCMHRFCHPCIKEWCRINNVCPLCRTTIQKIRYDIKKLEKKLQNTKCGINVEGVPTLSAPTTAGKR